MKKLIQIETKLAGLVQKFGVDKCLHFLVGFAFVLIFLLYGVAFGKAPAGWGGWATFVIVAASYLKEKCIDKDFDFVDVWATFLGAALAMLLYVPIDFFS